MCFKTKIEIAKQKYPVMALKETWPYKSDELKPVKYNKKIPSGPLLLLVNKKNNTYVFTYDCFFNAGIVR